MRSAAPGDGVVVGDPCFSAASIWCVAPVYPCPVAVDAEGMDPDGLEEALRNGARR